MKKKNNTKRKGTNAAKQFMYMALWKEEPPQKKKKVKAY